MDKQRTEPVRQASAGAPLLDVRGLRKHYNVGEGLFRRSTTAIQAVQDVSFQVRRGQVVGLVGESGSGKTTVGRAILRLTEPTAGEVWFDGVDLTQLDRRALRDYRKKLQIIYQDPYASLNPRMSVAEIVGEAFDIHGLARGAEKRDRVAALLERVGLSPAHMARYPHEFSGGQRQRIGIARALAVEPQFVVADEPVSALDVSIQAQIVNLLADLKTDLGLTLLFISHDMGVVRHIADIVIVMYLGKIMEMAPAKELYRKPSHPYTQALLSAVPVPDPLKRRQRIILKGDVPSPAAPPSGCVFRTRCPLATKECGDSTPELTRIAPEHAIACVKGPA